MWPDFKATLHSLSKIFICVLAKYQIKHITPILACFNKSVPTVNGKWTMDMPTYTYLSVRLRKPVHDRLTTLSLIDLTIGNNTTSDSATVLTYRVNRMSMLIKF